VQAAYLRARQVTFLQGYLYGRPMPMKEFARALSA
jgi:EAL domain-containing protein (putative c-di-GMP-specific phosphodiesterase class I)